MNGTGKRNNMWRTPRASFSVEAALAVVQLYIHRD